jgi:hypothetical protein
MMATEQERQRRQPPQEQASRFIRRAGRRVAAGALVVMTATPAWAHNGDVHQAMTDAAYHTMLLVEQARSRDLADDIERTLISMQGGPEMDAFLQAISAAAPKLRSLPAGLPPPKQSVCADTAVINKYGSSPSWGTSDFASQSLQKVPFAIKSTFITGNDCGIDPTWRPGGVFSDVNTDDHTGNVLGLWSIGPDDEKDDVHIFFRPTNMLGLSYLKSVLETALGAAAGTVWVPIKCAVDCIGSALTFGLAGDCGQCIDDAINDAKGTAHEGVSELDGLAGGFGDHTSGSYTGMSHHINVNPDKGGPWSVPLTLHDDLPGMLTDRAGPSGVPDPMELVTMAVADFSGMSVHYDPSLAPKRYEIGTGADGHLASIHRDAADWEYLSWPHVAFTPLDNLGMFGWQEAEAFAGVGDFPASGIAVDRTKIAPRLGWALHAVVDATVPMHVTGTFGWGHRPYEDAHSHMLNELLARDDRAASLAWVRDVLRRALVWRTLVLDWRATHKSSDVPIRELVTAIARKTMTETENGHMSVFNPLASSAYVAYDELPIALYELGDRPFYAGLMAEGVAATLALLTSTAEVLP